MAVVESETQELSKHQQNLVRNYRYVDVEDLAGCLGPVRKKSEVVKICDPGTSEFSGILGCCFGGDARLWEGFSVEAEIGQISKMNHASHQHLVYAQSKSANVLLFLLINSPHYRGWKRGKRCCAMDGGSQGPVWVLALVLHSIETTEMIDGKH